MKIFVVGDVQSKDNVPTEHLSYLGQYVIDKKPDVIVCIGDFADMPSLSSYDKGKRVFEGRRYINDIKAARRAMELFLAPLKDYQSKHKDYYPRLVMTLGNHEDRISRLANDSSALDGLVSVDDLGYEQYGWEIIPFLQPIEIEGVLFCHYFYAPHTGRPYGGTIDNIIKHVGQSFVAGHRQGLQCGTRFSAAGQEVWGIINGSSYLHNEDYIGPQGNYYWRGVVMLHNVHKGSFDPMFVSLEYFRQRYEGTLDETLENNYNPILSPDHSDLQELELKISKLKVQYTQASEALVPQVRVLDTAQLFKAAEKVECPYCKSAKTRKRGWEKMKDNMKKQIYSCRSCNKSFRDTILVRCDEPEI